MPVLSNRYFASLRPCGIDDTRSFPAKNDPSLTLGMYGSLGMTHILTHNYKMCTAQIYQHNEFTSFSPNTDLNSKVIRYPSPNAHPSLMLTTLWYNYPLLKVSCVSLVDCLTHKGNTQRELIIRHTLFLI